MPHFLEPLSIRGVRIPNRIVFSPMCQYSSVDGLANDWHVVHLGTRAVGGAGLVFTEAAAVLPEGRITPYDLGIWSDAQAEPLARIARFLHSQGAVAGIQISHAGRLAGTRPPWQGIGAVPAAEGGWQTVAPSPLRYDPEYAEPAALTLEGIGGIVEAFGQAARRASAAGFAVLEIHAGHGYLLHEFLSPLTNERTDEYGGSFENRCRMVEDVVRAVRANWPPENALFLRISSTDWKDGGWTEPDSIQLVERLAPLGIDLVDCSSGGLLPRENVDQRFGFQVRFARDIHIATGVLTGAVGLISTAEQAASIIRNQEADLVFLGRELLLEPYWPLRVGRQFNFRLPWPAPYASVAPVDAAFRGTLPPDAARRAEELQTVG